MVNQVKILYKRFLLIFFNFNQQNDIQNNKQKLKKFQVTYIPLKIQHFQI